MQRDTVRGNPLSRKSPPHSLLPTSRKASERNGVACLEVHHGLPQSQHVPCRGPLPAGQQVMNCSSLPEAGVTAGTTRHREAWCRFLLTPLLPYVPCVSQKSPQALRVGRAEVSSFRTTINGTEHTSGHLETCGLTEI